MSKVKFFRFFLMAHVSAVALMASGCASLPNSAETREEICKRKALAIRAAQATIAAFEAVCPFEEAEKAKQDIIE